MSPRLMSTSLVSVSVTASGGNASSRSPSIVTIRATVEDLPDGSTTIWSPGRTMPLCTVPLYPRNVESGRFTRCTAKRKSLKLRSDAICTFSNRCIRVLP